MTENLTRRQLLAMVGAVGGASAIYNTSLAMGLLTESGSVTHLNLQSARRNSRKVVILGAGISGLTVAYELERAGYDVEIIEAAQRIGGRNFTVRHGDSIDELGRKQVCRFDDNPDLYFNAGPARFPGHHRRVMHYCKMLQVPLQIKANFSRPAYTHDPDNFDGEPIRVQQFVADARGFLSELLYKAVDQNRFDQPVSAEDRERLLQFTTSFGDLQPDGSYKGSLRAGYDEGGFLEPAVQRAPLEFKALLNSNWWQRGMTKTEEPDWSEPLMEITGGMDKLVDAFVAEIRGHIRLNAQVQDIRLKRRGVDVVFNSNGQRQKISADYCFNSIPTHLMPGIPNNLPDDYREGLAAVRPGNLFKIGLQMKKRFWEDEGIYGGTTSTQQRINMIWYPSHGIHNKKGVVLGAYAFNEQSKFFERLSPERRIQYAAECGDKVHKGYSGFIESGVSVPWGRMNHMMGCGAEWPEDVRERFFTLLQQPAGGRHYMIGDQISYHTSWHEGAFASAEYALLDLDRRARAASTSTGGD